MSGRDKKIKGIPYGISDYGKIREDNFYYVDKTMYLPKIEDAGRYLFFIRPRRFGKSLMLSLLEAYYDVADKDRFDELFKGTWIYDHPGDEQGKYLVLTFNFSLVQADRAVVEKSFWEHVQVRALKFIQKYGQQLSTFSMKDWLTKKIEDSLSATDILSLLFELCEGAGQKLFVLIDEYDNFANKILTDKGKDAYHTLTHGTGFFRSFFSVLKGGTTGLDAPVTRSLITGVSPITMDDVTSGYNIGQHVSTDPAFNAMLGFTRDEVKTMLNYYKDAGKVGHTIDELLPLFDQWYGNYRFSKYALDRSPLYNSDMVLYFLQRYFKTGGIPDDLVDRNVRTDYGQLKQLILVDQKDRGDKDGGKTTNGNFSKLEQIIEKGQISSALETSSAFDERSEMIDRENFISLLFYLGLLTLDEVERDLLRFKVPNETMKRLFYDYIARTYRELGDFNLDVSTYRRLMGDMAVDGQWRPMLEFITDEMKKNVSLRQLIGRESVLQVFIHTYLGFSAYYSVNSEQELNHGYADLVLEPLLSRHPAIGYTYIIELKYLKTGEKDKPGKLEGAVKEAEAQLAQYGGDHKFLQKMGSTTLVKIAMVFSGPECLHMSAVD